MKRGVRRSRGVAARALACAVASGGALSVIAAMAVLTGCATDQRADVNEYRVISDPAWVSARPRADEPLALADALRLAATYNESLAVQGERYIQALAQRQRAAAALLPSIDFFTDVALRENSGQRVGSQGGIVQTDAGFTGQYRLLTGLSDFNNVTAADFRVESERWLILDLRETLLVQTALAYYQTLRAERRAKVLESSVQAQTERLADARARNEVGFTRPLDVSQIESQVSRSRAQLIAANQEAGEARSSLAFLINAPIAQSPLTDGFDAVPTPRPLEDYLSLAREHRQDVLAARAEADRARALVDAAIGQYAPSLSLNLDYFLVGAPVDPVSSIGSLLLLRVPIFTAGRIEADVREGWSVFREQVLTYHSRVREARRDVETAFVRFEASQRLTVELDTQVRVARQALELAEAAYQAGLGTNLERVIAQDQLLAAELESVTQAFATKTAYIELLRACGLLSADAIGATLPMLTDAQRRVPTSPFIDRVQRAVPGQPLGEGSVTP